MPFPFSQAPFGLPTAAPSSLLSTHTALMSPHPHRWQDRTGTQEIRSDCKRRRSMLALRSSSYSWVRKDPPYIHTGNPNRLIRVYVGLVCLVFLICSLLTNVVFFLIFLSLIGAFACLAGAYWNLALAYENAANTMAATRAKKLVVVSFPHCTSWDVLFTDTCVFTRRAALSLSSRPWPAGGSSSLSCSRLWTSRSVSPLAIYRISLKGQARSRRLRMPFRMLHD